MRYRKLKIIILDEVEDWTHCSLLWKKMFEVDVYKEKIYIQKRMKTRLMYLMRVLAIVLIIYGIKLLFAN